MLGAKGFLFNNVAQSGSTPAPPALTVLPQNPSQFLGTGFFVGLLLIKSVQCFSVFFDRDGRQLQGLPGKAVTQKIETVLDLADEGFGGVLLSVQAVAGLV